jgi:16S rRNA processing protein RimM
MTDYIAVGSFTKPHGLKGELIARFYNANSTIIEEKLTLYIIKDDIYTPLNIQSVVINNKKYIVKIEAVNCIDDAKNFINVKIFVKKEDINLRDNEYLVSDLIGIDCYKKSGENIGIITDIYNGELDILEIKSNSHVFLLPMTKENIVDINYKTKMAVIQNEEMFKI